jgi:membrane fusion protein, heavy metal efflux system
MITMRSNKLNVLLPLVILLTSSSPDLVLAGAGHDHTGGSSFKSGGDAASSITVDAETIKRLGLKIEPIKNQRLNIGIKTTGQIETLPDQKIEITAPLTSKVVQLLVQPGSKVVKGQAVAVVSSPELVSLRVDSQGKQSDARGALQKAQVDFKLAQDNLLRQQTISNAEISQARTKLSAAKLQYDRDSQLVSQRGVVKVAQDNLQRQKQIANAEINRAKTEEAIAQEQYDRDRELVAKGALPRRQMLESQGKLERARSESAKAKNLPQVVQAESELKKAEVDLPFRELRASQALVAESQVQLQRAETRKDFMEAKAQLERTKSDVAIAQSQFNLSNTAYQTRLQQLGSTANAQGLVTVNSPIAGIVASREVSVGQSLQDAGGKLMTIINDSQLFATANIYEKDLGMIRDGQGIRVKVPSLPDQSFEGRITKIGTSVQGETRVVPVQAALDNTNGLLKPGMFAELEVITDQTTSALLAIPASAVVDANGKKLVFVQNGDAFQAVEVTLGQTDGDLLEVKSGLFAGDMVVTKRATQLYAQSLRGGDKKEDDDHGEAPAKKKNSAIPPWLLIAGGLATLGAGAFVARKIWLNRKNSTLAPTEIVNDNEANEKPKNVNSEYSKKASDTAESTEESSPHYQSLITSSDVDFNHLLPPASETPKGDIHASSQSE